MISATRRIFQILDRRGPAPMRGTMKRVGLAVSALTLLASMPAVAAPAPTAPTVPAAPPAAAAPRVATPATPARQALARQLIGYTQPKDLMMESVLRGWDLGAAENTDDIAQLDSVQPGLGARLAERGQAELVAMVDQQFAHMQDQLATLFADNCSEEELNSLIAFYSSPTGRKMVRSIMMADTAGDAFDDERLTPEEAASANRAASKAAVKSLDGNEWIAAVKFGASPAGRAVKALSPQVQAISAEWLTSLMAEFGKRIEPIAEEMVAKAVEEADKQGGGD
jgi:hypothetical protein